MVSIIEQPKDKGILLKDVLESEVDMKYFLSQKMIDSFENKSNYFKEKGSGFSFKPNDGDNKARTITTKEGNRMENNYIICHNTMKRSSKSGKGGTGHLSRSDGKTYCLDTGQTNAIEIKGGDLRKDEGFRWRENGKTGTLAARARNDESCGQLASIDSKIRRLTPIECERLQTVKDNYTNHVSDSQRYKMLGNGWTIDVIAHIFSYLNI